MLRFREVFRDVKSTIECTEALPRQAAKAKRACAQSASRRHVAGGLSLPCPSQHSAAQRVPSRMHALCSPAPLKPGRPAVHTLPQHGVLHRPPCIA